MQFIRLYGRRIRATVPVGALQFEPNSGVLEVLSEKDSRDAHGDPSTIAQAPNMKTRLIGACESDIVSDTDNWGIDAVGAASTRFDGRGVVVAVLDTGISHAHEAFFGVDIEQCNFTNESSEDTNGHGTHCAATICGRDIHHRRIGIARGVKRLLVGKVLGEDGGRSEWIAKGLLWASHNGASIISMSLGLDYPGLQKELTKSGIPEEIATSIALEGFLANVRLFENLARLLLAQDDFGSGSLLIGAAGNESRRRISPDFVVRCAPPAACDGIISVGAVAKGNRLGQFAVADFSNSHPSVVAPGVGIVSAKIGGGLVSMDGTSMATPHVAGVCALWAQSLIEQTGRLKIRELAARLVGTAVISDGTSAFDVGTGIVQAPR